MSWSLQGVHHHLDSSSFAYVFCLKSVAMVRLTTLFLDSGISRCQNRHNIPWHTENDNDNNNAQGKFANYR